MPTPSEAFERLISKLERLTHLDDADREALRTLHFRLSSVRPHTVLVREGDTVTECCILLDGYACRHKATRTGGRQIVSFHLPGDILDLQHLFLSKADHNVETLTRGSVAWVSAAELRRLAQHRPSLNAALWRDTLVDASIFREWALNVGRRDAKSRIAHLLCEFAARRQLSGLGPLERFELPMTQEDIADATGLTSVHVNRMLKQLELDGAISREGRLVLITDWARLRGVAEFDLVYLHEPPESRRALA